MSRKVVIVCLLRDWGPHKEGQCCEVDEEKSKTLKFLGIAKLWEPGSEPPKKRKKRKSKPSRIHEISPWEELEEGLK